MSAARDQILGGIRKALGRGPLDPAERAELEQRLANPSPNLVPARGQLDRGGRLDLFQAMAEEAAATVARVASPREVPGAVADYLAGENLPAAAVAAPALADAGIPWDERPLLALRHGGTDGGDEVGIAAAYAGVAETGTLVMRSGPDSPSLLHFLPETEIVVLRGDQVVAAYEDAFAKLRADGAGADAMPRAVNLVSGPSRSADIEQTLQLGAHGPRRLHIILVDDGSQG
jgi:L-lactate dehydrogenase complex protein LldG